MNDELPDSMFTPAALQVATAVSGAASEGFRGTVAEAWGGLIGDRVRQWRVRNLINSLERTAVHLKKKGVSLDKAHVLPDGVLYSIFEGASKEEEPVIQDLWAGLLAGQAAGEFIDAPLKAIFSCLSAMTPSDAHLLKFIVEFEKDVENFNLAAKASGLRFQKIFEQVTQNDKRKALLETEQANNNRLLEEFVLQSNRRLEKLQLSDKDAREAVKQNLFRLGLIRGKRNNPKQVLFRSAWISHFGSRDPLATLKVAISQVEEKQKSLETWASRAISADEQPLGEFRDTQSIGIYWEPTQFGERFLQSVGMG